MKYALPSSDPLGVLYYSTYKDIKHLQFSFLGLIHQSLSKELEHHLLEHAGTSLENGFQLAAVFRGRS